MKLKWSYGILFILSFLVVVVLNVLSSDLVHRIDLTENQEYSLSESTTKVLDRLEDRLTIKLYFSKNLPAAMLPLQQKINDILQEYQTRTGKDVVVETIHPDLSEAAAEEVEAAGVQAVEVNVIEKDERQVKKVYLGLGIYYKDQKQVIPVLSDVANLEYVIDLSILKMTQKSLPTVGYLVGGQPEGYQLVPQLVGQIAKPIDLSKQDNWTALNLTSILLVNPVELDKKTLAQIEVAHDNQVPVLIFASTQKATDELKAEPQKTGLDDFLEKVGLALSNEFVLDPKYNQQAGFQRGQMQVYVPYAFWVKSVKGLMSDESIITKALEELVFPWTNEVQILAEQNADVTVLAHASENSFLEVGDDTQIDPDYINRLQTLPQMEKRALMVSAQVKDKGLVLVSGSASMIEDRFLQQMQTNAVVLINALEVATWGDFLVGVRSRAITSRPIQELDYQEKSLIKWAVTLGSPAVLVLCGLIFLGLRKKQRQLKIAALAST